MLAAAAAENAAREDGVYAEDRAALMRGLETAPGPATAAASPDAEAGRAPASPRAASASPAPADDIAEKDAPWRRISAAAR